MAKKEQTQTGTEMTKRRVADICPVLDKVSLSALTAKEKSAFIRILRAFRDANREIEDFRQEAVRRLAPADWAAVSEKVAAVYALRGAALESALSDPENDRAIETDRKYGFQIEECMRDELDTVTVLRFEALSGEAFGHLLECNPSWTAGEAATVQEAVCG